jgi:signal transduction histidine kinase
MFALVSPNLVTNRLKPFTCRMPPRGVRGSDWVLFLPGTWPLLAGPFVLNRVHLSAQSRALENTRLIAELRQRTNQLDRSVADLQRERSNKLMNLEAMAASISHEVRQPLTSIAANGRAAQRFLGHLPPNVEEAQLALNRMIGDSHLASQVFDNIRALFGKADEGHEPINANELIRAVVTGFQGDLEPDGIAADVKLQEDLPKILAHKGQLHEVLINLIRNAIEAGG